MGAVGIDLLLWMFSPGNHNLRLEIQATEQDVGRLAKDTEQLGKDLEQLAKIPRCRQK